MDGCQVKSTAWPSQLCKVRYATQQQKQKANGRRKSEPGRERANDEKVPIRNTCLSKLLFLLKKYNKCK